MAGRNNIYHLKIVQHNVRSWNTNKNSLTNIYNNINPDIILLNEHSAVDNELIKIFNYNVFTVNQNNERFAGAAIAVKRTIQARLDDEFEQDFLAVTIQTHHGPISIATAYIPPRVNYINSIDIHRLMTKPHPVYLLGDLNANHPLLGYNTTNSKGQQISRMIQNNICRHLGPDFKTWISHRTCSSPDIILSNNKAYLNTHFQPGPNTPSDHRPIIAHISTAPIQIPIKPRYRFSKTNWQEYRRILTEVHHPRNLSPTTAEIDDLVDTWCTKIQQATKATTPTIQYRTIPGVKPNTAINRLQNECNRLTEASIIFGPSPQLINELNDARRKLRENYQVQYTERYTELIRKLDKETDPKAFFRSINKMKGNNNKAVPYIIHNGNKLHTPQEQETALTEHWENIFTDVDAEENEYEEEFIHEISDNMQNRTDEYDPYHRADPNRLQHHTCFPISMNELNYAIKKTKNKASGPNMITAPQIKNLPINMKQLLLHIFNSSLSAGYFPVKYKHANMIFIPKSGSNITDINNRRPISLLNIDGKLLDRILNDRLYNYLDQNNYLNENQHGFRRNRGTHTALAVINETIAKDLAQKHKIDIVCRDVSKAFDRLWHLGLKYKILETNLNPCMKKVLCNFITDRTASVRIGSHTGPPFELQTGVAQGACLSPTMYSFFNHDIPPALPNSSYVQYADDITQIISAPGTHNSIAQNTEHAVKSINSYENKWKISTNVKKFKILNISRRKWRHLDLGTIEHKPYDSKITTLGLNIGTNGITSHVNIRKAIANKTLSKLYRFRDLSSTTKIKLYKTLVRPQLIYPIIPLNTISKAATSKLQKVQNKATRFILNSSRNDQISSKTLHESINLQPINTYIHNTAKNTWRDLLSIEPDLFTNLKLNQIESQKQHQRFKSSRCSSELEPPEPQYL